MTNLYGSAAPTPLVVPAEDDGPIQLGTAFSVGVPCVITHIRYYVASTALAAATGGNVDYQVWRDGEAASAVRGTLTIPGALGWVTDELSPHLSLPVAKWAGAFLSMPTGTNLPYGVGIGALPRTTALMTAEGTKYFPALGTPVVDVDPNEVGNCINEFSFYVDLEVAVSEFINLDPAALAVDDPILVRRNITGTVTAITPITDALTVAVDVAGGPLDGTNIDVWIPDTAAGLAAADMKLLKELPDPPIGSEWQAAIGGGGDGSLWVYHGGGVYGCFADGSSFREGSHTDRAATPSLIPWS